MNMNTPTLGIDIAKAKFDVALLKADGKYKTKVFTNDHKGHAALLAWLKQHGIDNLHVCMEATGVYGTALATALYDSGLRISVVNPLMIKGFGQSERVRTKNDRQDAKLIARYCRAMVPATWAPEPLNQLTLKAMVKRLEALIGMQQQESHRRALAEAVLHCAIDAHIAFLQREIERLRDDINRFIDDDPDLKQQHALLVSIPGIGDTTSACMLAYFSGIEHFSGAKKMAAFCGLAPREFQSGTSIRGRARLSKMGSTHLRKALFMPAMVALRHNPVLIKLKERLSQQGKPKMVIIGAAMRKLVHIIYGVLKNRTPFDENRACPA